jgi:hypothetical protein
MENNYNDEVAATYMQEFDKITGNRIMPKNYLLLEPIPRSLYRPLF